jgi:hypothetical protein
LDIVFSHKKQQRAKNQDRYKKKKIFAFKSGVKNIIDSQEDMRQAERNNGKFNVP